MTISRWKVMAGILGVSLGGLAAIAGQCPKVDDPKVLRSETPPLSVEAPKVRPGGSAPASKPVAPMAPLPDVPPPPSTNSLPPLPLPLPVVIDPKPLSGVKLDLPSKPEVVPISAAEIPALPMAIPPAATELPKPSARPLPAIDMAFPTSPGQPSASVSLPEPVKSPSPQIVATPNPIAQAFTPDPAPVRQVLAVAPATVKFRIILRVGEGEPMFEVRSGDDLVMKVLCEKVDIKSPEKGQGLSAVTATGKVRFVGFGAEGTCDSFSFLAGTGEVSMSGSVKVQVKDKIGRVESELTTDNMKYRLDSSAMPGVLKP